MFPPLVAGRRKERRALKDRLMRVRAGGSGEIVVVYGPRGNGKTTLLAELEGLAKQEGIRVCELEPSPLESKDPDAPWRIAGKSKGPKETTTKGGLGISGWASGSHEVKTHVLADSVEDLHSMAEAGPLLLLVDEAHELPVGFGKALLHMTQGCVKSRLPLLAVFAGTPGLPSRFRSMHASFWERAKRFKIGRLGSDDEVRDALSIPARQSGFPIDGDALELLVRHSQRYPFFIQMLGAAAWDAARERNGTQGRITLEDVQTGMEEAREAREDFYEERREELLRYRVLDEAEAVSKEMATLEDNAKLSWWRLAELLDSSNAQGHGGDPEAVRDRLVSLGLIWRVGTKEWEPGIPSLCAYLVENHGRRPWVSQPREQATD